MNTKPLVMITRYPDGTAEDVFNRILGHKQLQHWNDYAFDKVS